MDYCPKEKVLKDYQPGKEQTAGKVFGRANEYMERKDRQMDKDAKKIRNKAHKGRYD